MTRPSTNGTRKMRQAAVDKLRRVNALSYDVDDVILSNGGKRVLFNGVMVALEPDDTVLMPGA